MPKRSVKCQEASRSGGCQDESSLNVVSTPPRTWPLSGEYECVAIVSVASCTKCFRNYSDSSMSSVDADKESGEVLV